MPQARGVAVKQIRRIQITIDRRTEKLENWAIHETPVATNAAVASDYIHPGESLLSRLLQPRAWQPAVIPTTFVVIPLEASSQQPYRFSKFAPCPVKSIDPVQKDS